jgi:metal-responsive CopG/Arc/MetJ family transcriptional regulator
MGRTKIVIALNDGTLDRVDRLVRACVFPSRSRAIQQAIEEKLERLEKTRLARESARLHPHSEAAMADEGLAADLAEWPEY